MILPGHVAAGYLIAKGIVAIHPEISAHQASNLTALGAFFGWAPDLDLIYHFTKAKSLKFHDSDTHRYYITHRPFFWIMVGLIIFLFTGNGVMSLIITLASLSHIFFDSFGSGHGLMYLWPFSKKKFSFLPLFNNNPETDGILRYYFLLIKEYTKHLTFYLEVLVTIIALWVMYNL